MAALSVCLGFDWPGHVDRLAAGLASPDPRQRRELVRFLAATGSVEARRAVVNACGDSDSGVRKEALRAAGRLAAVDAIPVLVKALSDPDAGVRATAAEALGAMAAPDAEQALVRALTDAETPVRRAAVTALALLPAGGPLGALVAALDDVDGEVRVAAVRALGQNPSQRADDALLGKTRDASPEVRAAALEAITGGDDPRAVAALTEALDDTADVVVLAALRGLRGRANVPLTERLTPLTLSPRSRIATAARLILERAPVTDRVAEPDPEHDTAVEPWLPWLEHTADPSADAAAILSGLEATLPPGEILALDPLVLYAPRVPPLYRARLAKLMGRTHAPLAAGPLVKMLEDDTATVRAAAANALGSLGLVTHAPALERHLTDGDSDVRAAAAQALSTIADITVLRRLVADLEQEGPHPTAGRASRIAATAGCIRRLRHLLTSAERDRLLAQLRSALVASLADTQVEAARTLGELGDAGAVAALTALSPSARLGVRVAAARALLRADAPSALAALRELADSQSLPVRATALASLGLAGNGNDVPALQRALRAGPWPSGPVAAFALASLVLRNHAESHVLCAFRDAPEPLTRDNARAALRAHPAAQCGGIEPPPPGASHRDAQPPFRTWRALVISDGRVLISHPDARGEVHFETVRIVRNESPWRLPYGVR